MPIRFMPGEYTRRTYGLPDGYIPWMQRETTGAIHPIPTREPISSQEWHLEDELDESWGDGSPWSLIIIMIMISILVVICTPVSIAAKRWRWIQDRWTRQPNWLHTLCGAIVLGASFYIIYMVMWLAGTPSPGNP